MSKMQDPVIQQILTALEPVAITDGSDAATQDTQRRAAVLMPLWKQPDWRVILTQRPETMPNHAGQISFPGGKIEDGETALAAALRETEEEIGVPAEAIKILGRLPSFDARFEFRVTPYVGIIDPATVLRPDPREVADAFDVSFEFLMDGENHKPRPIRLEDRTYTLIDMPFTSEDGTYRNLWGMTAMIIYRLYQRAFEA